MKIRDPRLIRWLAWFAAIFLRLYVSTLKLRHRFLGPRLDPHQPVDRPVIYAFWHENIPLTCVCFATPHIKALISQHADGEWIAQTCEHMGLETIRGSTTRGGTTALRQMLRALRDSHLALVPDGPRGPRRHVEPGLIYLAAKTGAPLVLWGLGYEKAWRLGTWDRMAIPKPFSRAVVITSRPIYVPAEASPQQYEAIRLEVEAAMNQMDALAEAMAQGRKQPTAASETSRAGAAA